MELGGNTMVIVDSRTIEQIETERMVHASQVAVKHATGYFYDVHGVKSYDNAWIAGNYARLSAKSARVLHPALR